VSERVGARAGGGAAERLTPGESGAGAATVGELVDAVAPVLAHAGIAEARAEARDLVAAIAGQPRLWPNTHRDEVAGAALVEAAARAAERRARGAPFAYAVGRASFRHLTLDVDERVLIPRQETEVLVDEVLAAWPAPARPRAASPSTWARGRARSRWRSRARGRSRA
jgi:release factor glutamine methyltransferase